MSETAAQKKKREAQEAAAAKAKAEKEEAARLAAEQEAQEKSKNESESNNESEAEDEVEVEEAPLISTVHDEVIREKLAHGSTTKARQAEAANYQKQQEAQALLERQNQHGLGNAKK